MKTPAGIVPTLRVYVNAPETVSAVAGFFKGASLMSIATGGFGTPIAVGMAVAAAGALMKMISQAKSAGDMISPAGGKTMVSTKEGGLFNLSKNDDLLAGPGIAKASANNVQSNELRQNNTLMRKLIENFDKNYVPAIVQSNIDGGKGAGKQMGRQLAGI